MTMGKKTVFRLGRQLLRAVVILFLVCLVSFSLTVISPIDPLQTNIGQAALGSMSPEQIEKLEQYWGMNTPAPERFLEWLKGIVKGDLGVSLAYRQPVTDVIFEKLSNSFLLLVFSWLISAAAGVLLGMIAGAYRRRLPDKIIKTGCMVLSSTPSFWVALVILLVFSVWLKWFPIGFSIPIGVIAEDVRMAERIQHAVLPAAALSLTGVASITMHTREKMIEVMNSDYILYARAKGMGMGKILFCHGLRNVLLPAVTLQFASVSELIGGSVLVEQVFSYPGLGKAAVDAGIGGDVPLLLGITLLTSVFVIGGNLAAELLYGLIDPRLRKKEEVSKT